MIDRNRDPHDAPLYATTAHNASPSIEGGSIPIRAQAEWVRSRGSVRRVVALVTAALCVLCVSGTSAAPSGSAVALTFVRGFLGGDPAACAAATPRLQALLARLSEASSCRVALTLAGGTSAAGDDRAARRALTSASETGHFVIDGRLAARGAERFWTSARYTQAALARDLRDYGLQVRLGSGPAAARGLPDEVVVIDSRRSTRTRLVLYVESGSGTIWRLTPTTSRTGMPTRTATRGIRGNTVPATAFAYPPGAAGSRVLVATRDTELGQVDLLSRLTPAPLVDSLLVGAAAVPLRVGTGAADTTSIAEQIVGAWTRRDAAALCALYDRTLSARAAALFGTSCSVVRGATAVTRVVRPELEGWSADGTAIVAIRVTDGGETLAVHHVVTPGPSGYTVTGIFVDFDEIAELLLRPI